MATVRNESSWSRVSDAEPGAWNKTPLRCLAVSDTMPPGEFAQRILGATAKRSRLIAAEARGAAKQVFCWVVLGLGIGNLVAGLVFGTGNRLPTFHALDVVYANFALAPWIVVIYLGAQEPLAPTRPLAGAPCTWPCSPWRCARFWDAGGYRWPQPPPCGPARTSASNIPCCDSAHPSFPHRE